MSGVRLGLGREMPPGYEIVQLDSGHFIWTLGDVESFMHWDKWAIYRGAWMHYRAERSDAPKHHSPATAETDAGQEWQPPRHLREKGHTPHVTGDGRGGPDE